MANATEAPIKYEKDKFDELFQETGIAVLQFARGDELKMSTEQHDYRR